jgi:hypothetical protein
MSLNESVRVYKTLHKAVRLLELDDLWTSALATRVSDKDLSGVVAIGHEMQMLLRQLRVEIPRAGQRILRDRQAFDAASQRIVLAARLTEEVRRALRDEYEPLGWSDEVEVAFRYIEQESPREVDDLAAKVDNIQIGLSEPGDVAPWFKCCLRVVIFGLSIGAAILAGGAPGLLAMSTGASVLGLVDSLPGCRREGRRSPADTAAIEQLLELHRRGTISDLGLRIETRKVLGLPNSRKDENDIELEVFHRGLPYPIKVGPPIKVRKKAKPRTKERGD